MKIAISTETTADLNPTVTKEKDIKMIPFSIVLGEEQFKDGEKNPIDLFEFHDKTGILPRTCAVNQNEYEEYFKSILKDYDAVIHIALSSQISSSCSNAMAAAATLKNVYVIDSLTLSSGIGLLVLYAKALADAGKTPEEIVHLVEARRSEDKTTFVLGTLEYLYKGGRCSKLEMFGANLLQLKPEIVVNDGAMGVGKKYRGKWEKAVIDYVNDVLKDYQNPDLENVYITRTTAPDELIDKIEEILKEKGFRHIYKCFACGTISCHCGPNCLGILFLNDGEHPIN